MKCNGYIDILLIKCSLLIYVYGINHNVHIPNTYFVVIHMIKVPSQVTSQYYP